MASLKPETRLALQLSLVMWLAAFSLVVPATILAGQVESVGEYLSLLTGLATGLLIALLLFLVLKAVIARPRVIAWPILFLSVLSAAILQTAVDFAGQFLLDALFADFEPPEMNGASLFTTMLIYWCLYACNAALFWLAILSVRAKQSDEEKDRAQIAMLRLQLNPHFMINSLNAVTALMISGQHAKAAAMTDKLSQFLRVSLQTSSQPLIPLADELFAVETYLEAESIRYGDRLDIRIDCPADLEDLLVPNFILQPLVEGAVKHGVSASLGTTLLLVAARRDQAQIILAVESDAPTVPGAKLPSAGGIGLANTRSRLERMFGSDASLAVSTTPEGYRGEIRLPFRCEL